MGAFTNTDIFFIYVAKPVSCTVSYSDVYQDEVPWDVFPGTVAPTLLYIPRLVIAIGGFPSDIITRQQPKMTESL